MKIARYQVGRVPVDSVTLEAAVDGIVALVESGQGGTVYTPNVDHVVVAEKDPAFRAAYAEVSLSLVDGMPVFWAGRALGYPLPEKVSGSDLFEPLVERAAREGLSIFLLGGAPGVAEVARKNLLERHPQLNVVGIASPRIDASGHAEQEEELFDRLRRTAADIVFVACGAPKSELFSHRMRSRLAPSVLVCVGAAIDFAAGTVQRAPRWMSKSGLEWAYRLGREPRRLASRYLLRDPQFFWIFGMQLLGHWSAALGFVARTPREPSAPPLPIEEGQPFSRVRRTAEPFETATAPVEHAAFETAAVDEAAANGAPVGGAPIEAAPLTANPAEAPPAESGVTGESAAPLKRTLPPA